MKIEKGDIIEWCDEKFKVIEKNGNTGIVETLNGKERIRNFKFNYGGEESKLVKEKGK